MRRFLRQPAVRRCLPHWRLVAIQGPGSFPVPFIATRTIRPRRTGPSPMSELPASELRRSEPDYTRIARTCYASGVRMLNALRYYWIISKGYRLRPWASPYIQWRLRDFLRRRGRQSHRIRILFSLLWRERVPRMGNFLQWVSERRREAKQEVAHARFDSHGPLSARRFLQLTHHRKRPAPPSRSPRRGRSAPGRIASSRTVMIPRP